MTDQKQIMMQLSTKVKTALNLQAKLDVLREEIQDLQLQMMLKGKS